MKNVYRGCIPPNMAEAHMGSDVGPGPEGGERTNGLRRDASVQRGREAAVARHS